MFVKDMVWDSIHVSFPLLYMATSEPSNPIHISLSCLQDDLPVTNLCGYDVVIKPDDEAEVKFPTSGYTLTLENEARPLAFFRDIQIWRPSRATCLKGYDEEKVPRGPIIVERKIAEFMVREDKEEIFRKGKKQRKQQPLYPKHAVIFVPDDPSKGPVQKLIAYRWQVEASKKA